LKIFVFGSNLAGRHGKGAALTAFRHYGAQRGVGVGRTGSAYAIPTKDEYLEILPLDIIEKNCRDFVEYARANPDLRFLLTPVGTGLTGYHQDDIRPFFTDVSPNVEFAKTWESEKSPIETFVIRGARPLLLGDKRKFPLARTLNRPY